MCVHTVGSELLAGSLFLDFNENEAFRTLLQ